MSTPSESLRDLRQSLRRVSESAQARLGAGAPDIGEESLVSEYRFNPLKVIAFLQVLGGAKSPELLLMSWRILQGMEIKSIELSYRRQSSFSAQVVLVSGLDGSEENYESHNIQDFALLRRLGIIELSGKPILDGFYALNRKD